MALQALEDKFKALEVQYKLLEKENELLRQEKSTASDKLEHSDEFWLDIKNRFISDPDSVKFMIKNKTVTLNDTDRRGMTVLILAAFYGCYKMVQYCINAGADINVKDNEGKTALDWAKSGGYYNVVRLLLFAELNVGVGNDITELSK
eukprot:347434_1